ncbi:MAG: hypothetical protein J0I32_08940 [Sphingobacteriales bacterium]|nr:hypothetical protein [Sphingobacteriales bacterium]
MSLQQNKILIKVVDDALGELALEVVFVRLFSNFLRKLPPDEGNDERNATQR